MGETLTGLNIDKFLGNVKKSRIYRVGIELEGGWDKIPDDSKLEHDGSVVIPQPIVRQDYNQIHFEQGRDGRFYRIEAGTGLRLQPVRGMTHADAMVVVENHRIAAGVSRINVGEINSPILDLTSWKGWMKDHYPQHVNKTCGLHVHMSFRKAIHYERLMIPEYQSTILVYLSKWAMDEGLPKDHPIWERLEGKNEFCKHEFHADAQVRIGKKDYNHRTGAGNRYTAINYCHEQHGTLECRILPMLETCDQGVRAVQHVLDITNACLRFMAKKEKAVSAEFISDSLNDTLKGKREKILQREVSRNSFNG